MGLYFIPAGRSSQNRAKTLDRAWHREDLLPYLPNVEKSRLREHFSDESDIYLWGANKKGEKALRKLRTGEYVVDVKNKEVIQVFQFAFFVRLKDGLLQDRVGWDKEKPAASRRPYELVFFLKDPVRPKHTKKEYFQRAFDLAGNSQWLIGQRYFDDIEVGEALQRTSTTSIEAFLGMPVDYSLSSPNRNQESEQSNLGGSTARFSEPSAPEIAVPEWLEPVVQKVFVLKRDEGHLERDHEDLVAMLFERLGYERIADIRFRRGNIDIGIFKENRPLITAEVKADWTLSPKSRNAVRQAFDYAHGSGTPYVVVTNGDRYCVYDRRKGLSYEENLIADFALTEIDEESLQTLELLSKERIR